MMKGQPDSSSGLCMSDAKKKVLEIEEGLWAGL